LSVCLQKCGLGITTLHDRADRKRDRVEARQKEFAWLHQYEYRLLIGLLAVASAPFASAQDLRAPETFSSIANPAERSRALFTEAGRVLQHPRCPQLPSGQRAAVAGQ
jgi:hypothetical protein